MMLNGNKRPVMVDSNLIRYYAGDKMPANKHTRDCFHQFTNLIITGRDLRICLPQRVELGKQNSAYNRAIAKKAVNLTQAELGLILAIEKISHNDAESEISAGDISEILSDQERFGFGSALGDLLIAYLARRNGWALITAEGDGKPLQKYIRHYKLSP